MIMTKKQKLALGVVLILGLLYFFTKKDKNKKTYTDISVVRSDLSIQILATGTVQPENRLEIKPPLSGRVEKVLVKEGDKVKKGQILAWMSTIERAALLDAARTIGPEEVKKWEDLYRHTGVIAPIDGTIILRNIEPGQSFTTSDAILVMSDRLTVKALVDETDIGKIKLKQNATIVLDAYSQDKVMGIVDQIAFEAKTVSNVTSYQVDVLPVKTPPFMRAGMTANVTFDLDSKLGVLVVPNEALKVKNGKFSVLTKDAEGERVEKEIQVGISNGKLTEVLSGLQENDTIYSENFDFNEQEDKGTNPFSLMGRPKSNSSKTNRSH